MDTHETDAKARLDQRIDPLALLQKAFSYPTLLGALLVFAALIVARTFKVDPDTWWHLVVGRHIISTHTWPTSDTYSFTVAGADWIAYEWLAEVALALVMQAGGLFGWAVLLFLLAATTTLLIYYFAILRCRNPKAAFVATALVLPLSGVWFTLHPQLFGYIFLLTVLICLEHFRQGRHRALWLLPMVFMLWVNTHGTFVFGFFAFGVYWLCGLIDLRCGCVVADRWPVVERVQIAVAALVSLVVGCITPYGTLLLAYPSQMILQQNEITANMTSWQPIPLNIWHGKLFLVYLLIFVVVLAVTRPTIRLEGLILLLFSVVMTALHARALPLFAIVFAPVLADLLAQWVFPTLRRRTAPRSMHY